MTPEEQLADQYWRLNNLYWIVDKDAHRVRFRMNQAQEWLYHNLDYLNVVLKARQIGFTTFLDLYALDTCLFNSNIKAGIIAHTLNDAEVIFRDKIKFPYDNLPEALKQQIPADTARAKELVFSNDSSIRVSTSMRSGTLNFLHVSEYGTISLNRPDQAKEIRTGAFEAVAQGQMVVVESTAKGREGEFYDLCERARKHKEAHKPIGPMDFKFHFFPWFEEPRYRTDPASVVIPHEMGEYFERLALRGIELDAEQRAWYVKKYESLGPDMHQEHPSYPEEAFEAMVKGAYFASVMSKVRGQGRITSVPYEVGYPVNTMFDLGMNDSTSIWFHQRVGREHRLIDYMEGSGEGLDFYVKALADKQYVYGRHYMPHDASVRSLQTGKKLEDYARQLGLTPLTVVPRAKNGDAVLAGIEAVRQFLMTCWIDEAKCHQGITHLDNYRKEWDDKRGCFRGTPLHNQASHGADSLRTGVVALKVNTIINPADLLPEVTEDY